MFGNMTGVAVNVITVVLGSLAGLLFRNKIPAKITDAVMIGIGICTLYIGISGSLSGQNTLMLILSIAVGAAIGTVINIDGLLERLAAFLENKTSKRNKPAENGKECNTLAKAGKGNVARGFVAGSLLFCVGAMTITGSINSGVTGNNDVIYSKSLLDLISSAVLSVSLGWGVLLSALFVLIYQGALVLLAGLVAPFLSDFVIAEMTCAGSVLIIALGLNILGITKIKVANYLPAVFLPIALCPLLEWISSLV